MVFFISSAVISISKHPPIKYFNVTTDELFIPWIKENLDTHDLIIVSPDSGAENASHAFARELRCQYLKLSKTHPTLTGAPIVSDDETKFPKKLPHTAFIVDDFTLTGQTLVQTAALLRGYGITSIYAGVAHAPLTSEGKKLITDSPITKLLTTNTTDIVGDDKIIVLDATTQFIKCLHVIYELKEYQNVLQTPEN